VRPPAALLARGVFQPRGEGVLTVVPSGVLGVARAQELGCAYCFAG